MTRAQPRARAVRYGRARLAAGSRAVLSGAAGTYSIDAGRRDERRPRRGQVPHRARRSRASPACTPRSKIEGGQLYVRDEQSNNGTFVDGTASPARLDSGARRAAS